MHSSRAGLASAMALSCLLASATAASREEQLRAAVFNARVEVHWLAGGTRFWYRLHSGAQKHEFILVDAIAGTRKPAFDHFRLVQSLRTVLGKEVDAAALPISDIALVDDGRTWLIAAGGKWWEGPIATLALTASTRGAHATLERTPRPTRETGDESTLEFVNHTPGDIELLWSTFDGGRKSYGRIPPGGESHQNTYVGHVWVVTNKDGGVLGVERPAVAAGESK